jgi:GDPmannose 4,6-dehydratase
MGNIDSIRDWGHAKDFVNAMYLMLQHDEPDDFVIATGETHTVREFIEKAFLMKGLQISWKGEMGSLSEVGVDQNGIIRICMNGKYFRPTEVAYLQGDATKAKRLLGWGPECSFEELIAEMVDKDT